MLYSALLRSHKSGYRFIERHRMQARVLGVLPLRGFPPCRLLRRGAFLLQVPSAVCRLKTIAAATVSASCYDLLENVAVLPAVEAERELIDVQREVLLADVVERSHDATLQETPERVDIRRVDVAADILSARVIHAPVPESDDGQPVVGRAFVAGDKIDLGRNRLGHEVFDGLVIHGVKHPGDDAALSGDRTDNRSLGNEARGTMFVLRLPANPRFVKLDNAACQRAVRPLGHRGPDAVAHVPGGAVGTRADHPVDLQGADSFLRLAHEKDNLEPGAKRVISVLENRPDQRREPVAVRLRALLALPIPGPRELVNFLGSATRAVDAIRPTHLDQVGAA